MAVLRNEVSDHKLYAAEHFATKEGLTQALDRVEHSVDRLTERIDEFMKVMNAK